MRTRDPWICSKTRICSQTRYRLRYAARHQILVPDSLGLKYLMQIENGICSKISNTTWLQKGPCKQCKTSADPAQTQHRVFPFCYSDNIFENSSPENQHFIWKQKVKSVWNFRTLTHSLLAAILSSANNLFANYCKFGNFRENFIFTKSVKRNICGVKDSRLRYDLPQSIKGRVISPFREGLIKALVKISELTVLGPKSGLA